jgi:hypothetical protein
VSRVSIQTHSMGCSAESNSTVDKLVERRSFVVSRYYIPMVFRPNGFSFLITKEWTVSLQLQSHPCELCICLLKKSKKVLYI